MKISINNLSFAWKNKTLFENVNYHINEKQIIQLIGENGSGKTTLLHLISGMIPHFTQGKALKGDILINNHSIFNNSPKLFFPSIAFVPSVHLDFFLLNQTLEQEIVLSSSILKIKSEIIEKRLEEFYGFFPSLKNIMCTDFKNMEINNKILALTFIYYIQGACLYLFDEVLNRFNHDEINQWYAFFNWVTKKKSIVLFIDHHHSNHNYQKLIIQNKKLVSND